MNHQFLLRAALAALIATPISAPYASAAEAAASVFLNVRSGPGTRFRVVDVLAAGEVVEVTECQPNRWCRISHDGPEGWVSSNYLTASPDVGRAGADCQFQLHIGADGPRFGTVCTGGDVAPIGAGSGA